MATFPSDSADQNPWADPGRTPPGHGHLPSQASPQHLQPQPHDGQNFPAVITLLGKHDFHAHAGNQHPSELLRGRSAGVATSERDLIVAASHDPGDLDLAIATTGSKAKRMGISFAASFLLFWGGAFYGAFASFYPDPIGVTVVLFSFVMLFAAIFFGVQMIHRAIAGPAVKHDKAVASLEKQLGAPLSQLPVIFVGQHQLMPDERVVLQQMCGLYNLLEQRHYPMPVSQWKSLTESALSAVREHRHSGDLRMARQINEKISEWVAASEAAVQSRTTFSTRGIIPPQF